MEKFLFKSSTVNVNIFNKEANKFEDSIEYPFHTLGYAKKFFNNVIEVLTNEKGFKKVWSFTNSNNYIELENDIYHIQLAIYE